ncbi:hypothetical protein [Paraburkholderia hayleyella]|nr:hypothetical protein [Paraburkholderia hayleyella]
MKRKKEIQHAHVPDAIRQKVEKSGAYYRLPWRGNISNWDEPDEAGNL